MQEAADFAQTVPEPDAAELWTDMLVEALSIMATQILMPALSPTMTEGKLARWLKNVGDEVQCRRRDRRDRDRQGDHGSRSRR